MKNKILFSIIVAIMSLWLTSCNDKPIPPAQLPTQITTFIQQNFPGQTISYAEKDWDWGTQYEVTLIDGTHVKFDTDNVWDKIECPMKGVPATIVPSPVANYLNANFPGIVITKIDKEHYGYEIDLINGMELKLNKQGAIMEMDD